MVDWCKWLVVHPAQFEHDGCRISLSGGAVRNGARGNRGTYECAGCWLTRFDPLIWDRSPFKRQSPHSSPVRGGGQCEAWWMGVPGRELLLLSPIGIPLRQAFALPPPVIGEEWNKYRFRDRATNAVPSRSGGERHHRPSFAFQIKRIVQAGRQARPPG